MGAIEKTTGGAEGKKGAGKNGFSKPERGGVFFCLADGLGGAAGKKGFFLGGVNTPPGLLPKNARGKNAG
ncbi:hypothetical protein, partial [Escherichia coli]|uniref:hypothetical protein n=1 Tax=Escherichia coli TaxID=562 RepID=UPI001BCA2220